MSQYYFDFVRLTGNVQDFMVVTVTAGLVIGVVWSGLPVIAPNRKRWVDWSYALSVAAVLLALVMVVVL